MASHEGMISRMRPSASTIDSQHCSLWSTPRPGAARERLPIALTSELVVEGEGNNRNLVRHFVNPHIGITLSLQLHRWTTTTTAARGENER